MCIPFPISAGGGGAEPPTKFSKRGESLTGYQFSKWDCWETRDNFLKGCYSFYIKNKLKFKYLMTKKNLWRKMLLSVITKNLNWEVLTKNFLPFKRWDWVKNEKFQYYGGSLKNSFFFPFCENGIELLQW